MTGTVYDNSGAVVAGAIVGAANDATARRTGITLEVNTPFTVNMPLELGDTRERSGTTINVNGMRAQAGNVTIDGIEANEASNPTPTNNVFRINPDPVEGFKVTTSNPTPEEGKNSGLNVSNRNPIRNEPITRTLRETKRADLKSNQYGYEVGDPIRKNKTFFYSAWQGRKLISRKPLARRSARFRESTRRRRWREFTVIS